MPRRPASLGTLILLSGFCLSSLLHGTEPAAATETGEFDLTTPVRIELKRLQDSWQNWTRAYYQDNEEQARAALSQLLSVVENLGMDKLPDHAVASAALAVASAEEDNVARARWTVDCARQLDPGRPEPDFASSAVEWRAHSYPAAVAARFRGYLKLFRLPLEGHLFRQNLGIALIYLLTLSGGLFLLLLMAFRGADLFHDLGRLVSPPLARAQADVAAFVLLVWPLLLPSGLLWLALYWSILIWGYATASQRGVVVALWIVLGLAPAAVTYHQNEVREQLLPPVRAFENIETGRLYGTLFLDLEVLGSLRSDSPVVKELFADLHRDFGQWEDARAVYDQMIKDDPGSREVAAALNNVGIFYYRVRGDFGSAITFFTDATEADPSFAEAWYNLSRAYYANLAFTEAHAPLAEAKRRDPARVEHWERLKESGQDIVVPINGGLKRAGELRRTLAEMSAGEAAEARLLAPAYPSLGVTVVVVVAAVAVDLIRKKKGYPSRKFMGRPLFADHLWLNALAPGWTSTRRGQGVQAFLGVLFVVAMILVPILRRSTTYRPYLGYDAGPAVFTYTCIVVLVGFLGIRLTRALRAANG